MPSVIATHYNLRDPDSSEGSLRGVKNAYSANFALTEFSEVHYFGDAPRIQRYI
jgi:hypothetical protein